MTQVLSVLAASGAGTWRCVGGALIPRGPRGVGLKQDFVFNFMFLKKCF